MLRNNPMAEPPPAPAAGGLVDWVCARAEANRSLSRCDPCKWFELRDLATTSRSIGSRAASQLPPTGCAKTRPQLAWFMCLTPATDRQALKHLEYAKAAIISARLNAPSLAPYVVLVCEG